ncbi:ribose-phosphate pyrophosphokinase [Striga asiatica]|uniref:Ribose-phosphate pyrophosphokinase n=1 Tax=Striga asiatica TaxID=4170 RepID=A0A5A7QH27_STRAF|nr:ribose-phosphate pyrophosphokinase [Striga asiatica]
MLSRGCSSLLSLPCMKQFGPTNTEEIIVKTEPNGPEKQSNQAEGKCSEKISRHMVRFRLSASSNSRVTTQSALTRKLIQNHCELCLRASGFLRLLLIALESILSYQFVLEYVYSILLLDYFNEDAIKTFLVREIESNLGVELGKVKRTMFADGEIYFQLEESERGCDVYFFVGT